MLTELTIVFQPDARQLDLLFKQNPAVRKIRTPSTVIDKDEFYQLVYTDPIYKNTNNLQSYLEY